MTENEIANLLTPVAILLAIMTTAKWPGGEGQWFGQFWIYLVILSALLAVAAAIVIRLAA